MTINELADVIFSRCRYSALLSRCCSSISDEALRDACVEEAEFVGTDLEELGTSDVSCMARSAIRRAGGSLTAATLPTLKMRAVELRDIASALGLTGLYGTSKEALVFKIRAAQRGC